MDRTLALAPRAFAVLGAVGATLWGLLTSWDFATGESSSLLAAAGMLVLVTPAAALAAAWVNHVAVEILLLPVRWGVDRSRGRARRAP